MHVGIVTVRSVGSMRYRGAPTEAERRRRLGADGASRAFALAYEYTVGPDP